MVDSLGMTDFWIVRTNMINQQVAAAGHTRTTSSDTHAIYRPYTLYGSVLKVERSSHRLLLDTVLLSCPFSSS